MIAKMTTVGVLVAAVVALAGCGGGSVEDKVGKHYEGVESCRAVGKTELGKLYSCQMKTGTTICVSIDGNDVFNAASEAARAGISC